MGQPVLEKTKPAKQFGLSPEEFQQQVTVDEQTKSIVDSKWSEYGL